MMVVTTVPTQHAIFFSIAKILQAQRIPKKRNEWQNHETDFLCWHRRPYEKPYAACCWSVSSLELMSLFLQKVSVEAKSQLIHTLSSDGNRPPDVILS